MIRAHLLEGEKLAQKDNFLGLRGKSDPYAKVSIGLQHFRSRTIYKNLNPTWNEVFEVRLSLAAPSCSPCPPGLHSGWFCPKQGRALPSRSSHTHGQHSHRRGPWEQASRDGLLWPLMEGQPIDRFLRPFPTRADFVGSFQIKSKNIRGSPAPVLSAFPPRARHREPEVLP